MRDKIAIKRVKFHDMPDFIYSIDQWDSQGGWKGFLRDQCISIRDVSKVLTETMDAEEFYRLPAWEG